MIRTIGLVMGSALMLGACSQTPEAVFKANCAILVEDPEAVSSIRDMGANAMSFCGCMVDLTAAKSAEDQASIRTTLAALTAKMQETGQGVEEVARSMMSDATAQPDDADAQATAAGIDAIGRLIDDIEDAFDEGSCQSG